MAQASFSLDDVRVASPCHANWDGMMGGDRVRFCGHCQRNVYNLSGMSRPEAEALVQAQEGRLCVRFYRRRDGTVLTRDCPVGLRAARKRLLFVLSVAAGLLFAVVGWAAAWLGASREGTEGGARLRDCQPFKLIADWLDPEPPPPPGIVMGECPPLPPGP